MPLRVQGRIVSGCTGSPCRAEPGKTGKILGDAPDPLQGVRRFLEEMVEADPEAAVRGCFLVNTVLEVGRRNAAVARPGCDNTFTVIEHELAEALNEACAADCWRLEIARGTGQVPDGDDMGVRARKHWGPAPTTRGTVLGGGFIRSRRLTPQYEPDCRVAVPFYPALFFLAALWGGSSCSCGRRAGARPGV